MPEISPHVSFWIGLIATVVMAIGTGSIEFANAIPAGWVPAVTAWLKILGVVLPALLTYLHGVSAPQTGVLVK